MKYTKKQLIEKAIRAAWFSLSEDYALYLYNLTPEEEADEHQIVANAWKTLADNGMGFKEVQKHADRMDNSVPAPIRFIDRQRFATVEADELPL